jgi:hypothetical protein
LLIVFVAGYFLIASQKTPLQREGQAAQSRLTTFCQENSVSSINYSQSDSGTGATFGVSCQVLGVKFEYARYKTVLDRIKESDRLGKESSGFPHGLLPVLSTGDWIAFPSGRHQTETDYSNPLEFAQNFLGGRISYLELVDGFTLSYSTLSAASVPACSRNLVSWVSSTADDALAGVANEDWVTQFGANSSIGLWIQDELAPYAQTDVNNNKALAKSELQVAANRLCKTGTASQNLAIPAFW